MKNWIGCYVQCCLIILIQVFSIARHLPSTDDLDTLVCFLDFQGIIEFPRKMQNPEIDRLEVRQPPQSESQYACNLKLFSDGSTSS